MKSWNNLNLCILRMRNTQKTGLMRLFQHVNRELWMTTWHVTVQTDLQCHEEEADNYPRSDNSPRHLMVTSYIVCMVTSGHGPLCSGPAPPVMRHWDTGHTDQYSVFRQTPENQQQHHDRQGYPRPRLCPSWIVSWDWSGKRLKCVSFVSQPFWCDPLEVPRIHCVRINHIIPQIRMKHWHMFKYLDTRTQTSLPCTPMMSTCASPQC